MPYRTLGQLPDAVRDHLPKHAQEVYKEAFNHAWDEYADKDKRRGDESREEAARKVAWSAVKRGYVKNNDGRWHAKQVRPRRGQAAAHSAPTPSDGR